MGGMRRAGEAPKVLAPKLGAELAPNAGAAGCAGAAGAPLLAPNVKSPHEGGVVPPKAKTGVVEAGGGAGGDTGGGSAGNSGTGVAPLPAPNVSPPAGGVVPPKVKTGAGVKAGGADDGGTGASFMDRSAVTAASSS